MTAVAFSPEGKTVISGGYRQLLLWDAANGKLLRRIPGIAGQVRALAFGKDGLTLAVASGVSGRSGAVVLVDAASGAITPVEQAPDEVLALAYSPDFQWLATGGTGPAIHVWNLAAKTPAVELKGHSDWVTGLAFSPDGKMLASSSNDKTTRIWRVETWKEEYQMPLQITEPVRGLAFAPEGDMMVFTVGGTDERSVRIWRTQGALAELDPARPNARTQLLQTRPMDTGACLPLAVAFIKAQPHSRILVGCTDKTVRLMGPGGNTIGTATGHEDWVYAVAANPDGTKAASGSGDGTVRIWNPAGKLLLTLDEGKAQP